MARIVLIEDNNDLRDLLTDSLVASGHSVWSTRDGRAGVKRCERLPTDLVITDLVVPNSDALEELVSLQNTGLQVVVISGALDSPHAASRAARLAGANVLAKPFRAEKLVHLVQELQAHSAAHS